jgi:hypothetical protein
VSVLKKALTAAALSVIATGVGVAPAFAVDNTGPATAASNGDGASQYFGNSSLGPQSVQVGLVQGSLNKPCLGFPVPVHAQSLVGLVPVGVQDILDPSQYQACDENSTQAKGDDPLSHILDEIPVLSENGKTGLG